MPELTPEEQKTAADKKAADDAAAAAASNGEETVTMKKSELDKIQSDLENYKNMGIKYKNDRNLPDPEQPGQGSAPSGGAALDEKKVAEIATQASASVVRKKEQKNATSRFLKDNPDYIKDENWQALLPFITIKGEDQDEDAIYARLQDAVLTHKRRTGQLETYLADQRAEAQRQAEINAQVNLGASAGGVGGKVNPQGVQKAAPGSTVEMGRNFGHSEEKLEEALNDIGPRTSDGFVLDVTKPKK